MASQQLAPSILRWATAVLVLCSLTEFCHAHSGKMSQHPEIRSPVSHFYPSSNGHGTEHIDSHIKEDLGLNINIANATAEELDWYFFMLHDTDKNFMLDGIELLQGWLHTVSEAVDSNPMQTRSTAPADGLETATKVVVDMIDDILAKQDVDGDGYLTYTEYVRGKKN